MINRILLLSPDPVIQAQGLSILEDIYPPSTTKSGTYSTFPSGIEKVVVLKDRYWQWHGSKGIKIEVYTHDKNFHYPPKLISLSSEQKLLFRMATKYCQTFNHKYNDPNTIEAVESQRMLYANHVGIIAVEHVFTDEDLIDAYIRKESRRERPSL